MTIIALATPHPRHDDLEAALRALPGITVIRFRSKDEFTAAALTAVKPRYVFLPHWSWKIPADIFENFECVIFHMTDLPFGRGGSPLQNLIVRGFRKTRISALRCIAELDAGDIYMKCDLSLEGTAEEILCRASDLTGDMIKTILRDNPVPVQQSGQVTAFQRRKPQDGDIAGLTDLERVYDHIRMLDGEGYPPAFLEIGDLRLEFSGATLKPDAVEAVVRIKRR